MASNETLRQIQEAVAGGSYIMTAHALLEMRADHLDVVDIESAILTGRIAREFTADPRGTRYEVVGTACDLTTPVAAIVRLEKGVLIVTVYEVTR